MLIFILPEESTCSRLLSASLCACNKPRKSSLGGGAPFTSNCSTELQGAETAACEAQNRIPFSREAGKSTEALCHPLEHKVVVVGKWQKLHGSHPNPFEVSLLGGGQQEEVRGRPAPWGFGAPLPGPQDLPSAPPFIACPRTLLGDQSRPPTYSSTLSLFP